MNNQYFSPEGLEKLKKELEERRGSIRADITRKILDAKELGDLSENAEYIEAREMQGFNEGRIIELEDIIKNAMIIEPHQKQGIITVGSTVRVNSKHGDQKFTIVGPAESNPIEGFISNESPLGTAFIGRKKNEDSSWSSKIQDCRNHVNKAPPFLRWGFIILPPSETFWVDRYNIPDIIDT